MIESFRPTLSDQWDRRKAAHLLWRAGFGPLPGEVDRAVRDGLGATVERLLTGPGSDDTERPPAWTEIDDAPVDPRRATEEERRRLIIQNIVRNQETKGWFLERFAFSKHPLREKMALFWHGHLVTESRKVNLSRWVYQYVRFLRDNGLSDLGTLLRGISREPAMLRYLDNVRNRRGNPNENYARELLELFSMGVGNYTEDDVKAAARAFTGWTVVPYGLDTGFRIVPFLHDDGEKTFLGRTGRFGGDEIIEIVLQQEATARFICSKLCRFFVSESPDPALVDGLSKSFRESGYRLRPTLEALFTSRAFYRPEVIGTQIKSPVELVVGTWRQLRAAVPQPRLLLDLTRLMGQDLLDPPNVKGWDGGTGWINTSTLAVRQNIHQFFVEGRSLGAPPGPGGNRAFRLRPGDLLPPGLTPDVDYRLLAGDGQDRSPEELVRHFLEAMVTAPIEPAEVSRLVSVARDAGESPGRRLRALLPEILKLPHYQLC